MTAAQMISTIDRDLSLLKRLRIGQGYDTHRLVPDRALRLGGITVENSTLGSLGHSDGDVVLHALIDAMLSACHMPGDIGTYFPPSDPSLAGINSVTVLQALLPKLPAMHWLQVDVVIFLESPKLGDYKNQISAQLQHLLNGPTVSVKAKTAEGLDAVGQLQAVSAAVLVMGVALNG